MRNIYIGFDPREATAFAVCRHSINRLLTQQIHVKGIVLDDMRRRGLYSRPTEWRKSAADKPIMWDVISDAPMSTEFAISRFLTPHLAQRGWALFMDCDMMAVGNFARLFERLNPDYAVMCVKHNHSPVSGGKMDGQVQTAYARKNWSSFMLFNCDHPSNKKLTVDMVNTLPGRDLHRFCWLDDKEIGELDVGWNWLVGEQPEPAKLNNVHYTMGGPWFHDYENVPYADRWREQLISWAG